ncbi:MAG TPA: ABC transporter permease, partial [Chitinophagaceae bacterium]|nr:ABC transporter permease [Chitinophagaceae bacterium]
LYQVKRNFNSNGDTLTLETTSLKLANALRSQIPEIEYVAESDGMGPHGLMVDNKKLYVKGARIGGDFLKMFQYPLLQGNPDKALQDPFSIVLTQSTARSLFGRENPINKTVLFDNHNYLKVTGILKDLPSNSSLQFHFLVPFSYYEQTEGWVKQARRENFAWNDFQQFVQLRNGVSYAKLAAKIRDIEKTEKDNINAINSKVILEPFQNRHLYTNYENGKVTGGFIVYVRMFEIIGALVLLIACINFVNLTTARSEKRSKEIGVRKAIGSQRKDLVIQFLMESFLLTFIAFLFSFLFVLLALPAFNTLTGSRISIPFSSVGFWVLMIVSVLITSLVAGSRPAIYLSSLKPLNVLKGNIRAGRSGSLPRKVLVVIQFTCSVALIISTLVIYRQIQYAEGRPKGYNIDRLMITDLNSDLANKYTPIKNELISTGIAETVTAASSPATDLYWHSNIDGWPGMLPGETAEMGTIQTAEDYFKTLGIPIQSGRDFSLAADSSSVIFNETAIRRLRLKQPLNQMIIWQKLRFRIVGVVKDALISSPFATVEPTLFLYHPSYENYLMYRLSPQIKTQEAIAKLTGIFNKYNPAFPYTYQFADQNYAAKFNLEILIGKLAGIFAGLAILISCLGLFGLAAYIAELRTKEIGIRKVLGASLSGLWLMLTKDFIVLVLISCVIASPIAYYFLQHWLLNYDYRIRLGPLVFIIAALTAILVTMATISFQAIRAARANPAKSLRAE